MLTIQEMTETQKIQVRTRLAQERKNWLGLVGNTI
ncbi:DUF3811 domain-containing protein [Providencia rettgeri]